MIRVMDYGIDADSRQFIVGKLGKVKQPNGAVEEGICNPSYVSTLSAAYRAIYAAKVKDLVHQQDMDMRQAYKQLRALEARIQALFDQASSGA